MPLDNSSNSIGRILEDHERLVECLEAVGEVSLRIAMDSIFAKTLLLSAASYYEYLLTEVLIGLYESSNDGPTLLAEFVKNQAIGRRYAQLFDWTANNANRFFRLFGGDFSSYMQQTVHNDTELQESIRAFLELGNLRNQLVHENYAEFPLDKTVEEIFDLYQKARRFAEGFPEDIERYTNSQPPIATTTTP